MVRAILAGRKTQTRRIFKDSVSADCVAFHFYENNAQWRQMFSADKLGNLYPKQWGHRCPYGIPGDRLWVRETWRTRMEWDALAPSKLPCADDFHPDIHLDFAATIQSGLHGRWRPSIHMPRWASRITLEIESVRVERLNSMPAEEARCEGCGSGEIPWMSGPLASDPWRNTYAQLWESINGAGSWALNPWVWVVTFRSLATEAKV